MVHVKIRNDGMFVHFVFLFLGDWGACDVCVCGRRISRLCGLGLDWVVEGLDTMCDDGFEDVVSWQSEVSLVAGTIEGGGGGE